MTEEDKAMVPGKELILGLFAQTAIRNAKSRSSPVQAAQYIARNAFQSAKQAPRLTQTEITDPLKEIFLGNTVPIKCRLEKGKGPLKRRNHFLHVEKSVLKYLDGIRRLLKSAFASLIYNQLRNSPNRESQFLSTPCNLFCCKEFLLNMLI